MKVRQVQEQLLDLQRRGFGDDTLQIEMYVESIGSIHRTSVDHIDASVDGVVLTSEPEE